MSALKRFEASEQAQAWLDMHALEGVPHPDSRSSGWICVQFRGGRVWGLVDENAMIWLEEW